MYYLDDDGNLSLLPINDIERNEVENIDIKNSQVRKNVDIFKNFLLSNNNEKDSLIYSTKIAIFRVEYQSKRKENKNYLGFFKLLKSLAYRFIEDLKSLKEKEKINLLKKAFINALDVLLIKSYRTQNYENQNAQTQNQGFNRPSYRGWQK